MRLVICKCIHYARPCQAPSGSRKDFHVDDHGLAQRLLPTLDRGLGQERACYERRRFWKCMAKNRKPWPVSPLRWADDSKPSGVGTRTGERESAKRVSIGKVEAVKACSTRCGRNQKAPSRIPIVGRRPRRRGIPGGFESSGRGWARSDWLLGFSSFGQ